MNLYNGLNVVSKDGNTRTSITQIVGDDIYLANNGRIKRSMFDSFFNVDNGMNESGYNQNYNQNYNQHSSDPLSEYRSNNSYYDALGQSLLSGRSVQIGESGIDPYENGKTVIVNESTLDINTHQDLINPETLRSMMETNRMISSSPDEAWINGNTELKPAPVNEETVQERKARLEREHQRGEQRGEQRNGKTWEPSVTVDKPNDLLSILNLKRNHELPFAINMKAMIPDPMFLKIAQENTDTVDFVKVLANEITNELLKNDQFIFDTVYKVVADAVKGNRKTIHKRSSNTGTKKTTTKTLERPKPKSKPKTSSKSESKPATGAKRGRKPKVKTDEKNS